MWKQHIFSFTEFPDGPVVRTWCSHWLWNKTPQAVQHGGVGVGRVGVEREME